MDFEASSTLQIDSWAAKRALRSQGRKEEPSNHCVLLHPKDIFGYVVPQSKQTVRRIVKPKLSAKLTVIGTESYRATGQDVAQEMERS